jgi:hypothetical protein
LSWLAICLIIICTVLSLHIYEKDTNVDRGGEIRLAFPQNPFRKMKWENRHGKFKEGTSGQRT